MSNSPSKGKAKPARDKGRVRYRNGIIRHNAQGTFRAEVNHAYKRYRKTWRTEAQAKAWIDKTQIHLDNENTPLGLHEDHDARKALDILPDGITLVEAARHWTQTHESAPRPALPLEDAIRAFLEEKAAAGLRPSSVKDLRTRLMMLQRDHPEASVQDITSDALLLWLNAKTDYARSRKNYRNTFQSFFNWCIKAGLVTRNPTDAITVPRADDTLPGILTTEQAQALLEAAETQEPSLCPYIALGLFAGLRSQELKGLQWSAVNGATNGAAVGHVHVGPDIAKTRQQRYVDIAPNLAHWLEAYHQPSGPVIPINFARRFRRVLADARIAPWPSNALRHSFATYHLALHQDAARTALQLGHATTTMLFKNYRNLATQGQAELYFSLAPQSPQR